MESLLIGGIVLGITIAGIVITIKRKQMRQQETIRIMEKYEKEKLLRNLQHSWDHFHNTKVRPSIRSADENVWSAEEESAREAWDKILKNNKYSPLNKIK
jgi:hypothetical protein